MMFTVGKGNSEAHGEVVSVPSSSVDDYAQTLEAQPPGFEAWWAPVVWTGNHRLDKNWTTSTAATVDVDFQLCACAHDTVAHERVNGKRMKCQRAGCACEKLVAAYPSTELVDKLVASLPSTPGSFFHLTPHGCRFVFVFNQPCTDRELARRANIGAGEMIAQALTRRGLVEYEVDKKILPDLARFFYTPNSLAKGKQRSDKIMKMRERLYGVDELADWAPIPAPAPIAAPKKTWNGSTRDPIEHWNADHPIDFERRSAGRCPVCDDSGSFGRMPNDDTRWYCFSTDHPDSVGIAGSKGYHGDSLDLEAHGSGMDRAEILRRDGYLKPKRAPMEAPPDLSVPIEAYTDNEFQAKPVDNVTHLFDTTKWPRPILFSDFNLPLFPVGALPGDVKNFVEELAVATQTPPDLSCMLSLAVMGAATAKRGVCVVRPGYVEPLNIFTAAVLDSGERKSGVLREIQAPLTEWDKAQEIEAKPRVARSMQLFRVSEKRLAKAESLLLNTFSNREEQQRLELEAEQLALKHADLKIYEAPRLLADDCTQEALGSLLHAQGGRMAILSAEGGVFSMLAGRYSDQPNLDVYLKAHAGDMLRVDRKQRDKEHVENPALTLGLAVQPGIIEKLSETPLFRSTGLLARFLYALPVGMVGNRVTKPAAVLETTRAAYKACITRILAFNPATPIELKADTMAYQEWCNFVDWVEPQLREFENMGAIRDWGSKLPGAVARIAGIFSLISGRPDVDAETMKNAITIGRYLIPHAIAAFAKMGLDSDIEDAKVVLRLIKKKQFTVVSKKQLYDSLRGQQRFKTAELLDKPINILVLRYFLRRDPNESTKVGRPREVYLVNPEAISSPASADLLN